MPSDLGILYRLYEALNNREIDAVLDQMTPDVEWPSGWEGGTIVGYDAIRDYWTRQWAAISPHWTPEGFTILTDGRLRLEVRQTVRGLDGIPLSRTVVGHVYTFRDGKVARMEAE